MPGTRERERKKSKKKKERRGERLKGDNENGGKKMSRQAAVDIMYTMTIIVYTVNVIVYIVVVTMYTVTVVVPEQEKIFGTKKHAQ